MLTKPYQFWRNYHCTLNLSLPTVKYLFLITACLLLNRKETPFKQLYLSKIFLFFIFYFFQMTIYWLALNKATCLCTVFSKEPIMVQTNPLVQDVKSTFYDLTNILLKNLSSSWQLFRSTKFLSVFQVSLNIDMSYFKEFFIISMLFQIILSLFMI